MAPMRPGSSEEARWGTKQKRHSNLLAARFSGSHQEIPEDKVKMMDRLGAGSAGHVFKARYKGETCAVKILHAKFSETNQEHDDFMKEIKVLTHLQHPNIVRVVGACTKRDGEPFLVYELMDGGSLQDLFNKNKRLKLRWCPHETKVMRWCMDLLAALAFMHRHKLLHRDVKLANILMSSDFKRIKVGDFGLCRIFEGSQVDISSHPTKGAQQGAGQDGTMTGMTGTYRYMAPEIFEGARQYTDKVDVYSAALCMWSICAGERPFDDLPTSALEGGAAARMGGLRPPLDRIENKELADVIAGGWAHWAKDRSSAAQMHARIEDMYSSTWSSMGSMGSVTCLSFLTRGGSPARR